MVIENEIAKLLEEKEGELIEFKAVLPPSRSIAQILCAFANTRGGSLVLGVDDSSGRVVTGLSKDFHANSVTQKAISLLSPQPVVTHKYVEHQGKSLYRIDVEKSGENVTVEGRSYVREGVRNVLTGAVVHQFRHNGYERISTLASKLESLSANATGAKSKFIGHLQSVLKITDDLAGILYPSSPTTPTSNQEGKILVRILFSSCADTFESYLSDLLYEIYLAKPQTLMSDEQVTITDVLRCTDIEEFVDFWARKKLAKLQRGSVKGFITDNKQFKSLNVFDSTQEAEIEKILQIRHLYSHKNGIVDEKFLSYFPDQFTLNSEHRMTIEQVIDCWECLADTVERVDAAALNKFSLASVG